MQRAATNMHVDRRGRRVGQRRPASHRMFAEHHMTEDMMMTLDLEEYMANEELFLSDHEVRSAQDGQPNKQDKKKQRKKKKNKNKRTLSANGKEALSFAIQGNVQGLQAILQDSTVLKELHDACQPLVATKESDRAPGEKWNKKDKELENIVVTAALFGGTDVMQLLIQKHRFNVDSLGTLGLSALQVASCSNNRPLLECLVDLGSDLLQKDAVGLSVLHLAVHHSSIDIVRLLCSRDDVKKLLEVPEGLYVTPLQLAIERENLAILEVLVQCHTRLNPNDNGMETSVPLSMLYDLYRAWSKKRNKGKKKKKKGNVGVSREKKSKLLSLILDLVFNLNNPLQVFNYAHHNDIEDEMIDQMCRKDSSFFSQSLKEWPNIFYGNLGLIDYFQAMLRMWKRNKRITLLDVETLPEFLSLVANEGSRPLVQELYNCMCTKENADWIMQDGVLDCLFSALKRAGKVLLYGIEPRASYCEDFFGVMSKAAFRITIASSMDKVDTINRNKAFESVWSHLDDCISQIDASVMECSRFGCLVYVFFLYCQTYYRPQHVIDSEHGQSPKRKRASHSKNKIPSISHFEMSDTISDRFLSFATDQKRSLQLLVLSQECPLSYMGPLFRIPELLSLSMKSDVLRTMSPMSSGVSLQGTRFQEGPDSKSKLNEDLLKQIAALPKGMPESIEVQFASESGIGAGPVRELLHQLWAHLEGLPLSQRPLVPAPSGGTLTINTVSEMEKERAEFVYNATGRILGMALTNGCPLGVCLSTAVLKRLCGSIREVTWEDLDDWDKDFQNGLGQIVNKDIDELDLYWTFTEGNKDVELRKNGSSMKLAPDKGSKVQWANAYTQSKVFGSDQSCGRSLVECLVSGFRHVLPQTFTSMLTIVEIQQLIEGPRFINLGVMKQHVEYEPGLNADHEIIQWFWSITESMSMQEQRQLVEFWTGSSILPLFMLASVEEQKEETKKDDYLKETYLIDRLPGPDDALPNASTCSYALHLPTYSSRQVMECRLKTAVKHGRVGFDQE